MKNVCPRGAPCKSPKNRRGKIIKRTSHLTPDRLLLEHVLLPHVLNLDIHVCWMSQGVHSEPLLLLELFYQSTPSCLKVIGWGGGVVVAHGILVSAQVPLVLTLGLWTLGLRTWA